MDFWSSIRPGDILTFLGFLIGGFSAFTGGYFMMKNSISLLEQTVDGHGEKIDAQGEKIDKLNELLALKLAYEERFKSQENRVNGIADSMRDLREELRELRHWKGFINPPPSGLPAR